MENKNQGVYQGRSFWSGSVSLTDGCIEEIHTYEEAEAADFHHSIYFSQTQVERIADGECTFFCINNGQVEVYWRDNPGDAIAKQIADKIEFSVQPVAGIPLRPFYAENEVKQI